MTHQDTLKLAKQGDPTAITALINRALQPKGITAKVRLREGCLEVLLEADQTPNQEASVNYIRNGIEGLNVAAITKIVVYGRQKSSKLPSWTTKFDTKRPAQSITANSKPASTPKVIVASSAATEKTTKAATFLPQSSIGRAAAILLMVLVVPQLFSVILSRFQPPPEVVSLRESTNEIEESLENLREVQSKSASAQASKALSASGITLSKYNQLQMGMSYAEVEGILGAPGKEMSRNSIAGYSTVMYSWSNSDGSNMNAMFQNDELVQKAQWGL